MEKHNEEMEIDLLELFHYLKKRIIIIAAVFLVFAVAGFLGTKLFITPEYTTNTRMYVLNRSNENNVVTSDFQIATYVMNDYKALITGQNVTTEVINRLGLDMKPGELSKLIQVTSPENTRVLQINITHTDPQKAADIANTVREVASAQIKDIMDVDAVKMVYAAEVPKVPSGPSVMCINNVSLALVCIFGSLLFLRREIGLGDLSSFVQYSRRFSGPINEVANIFAELQSAFAAAERVFFLIDAEPEPEDAPDARVLTGVKGDVEIQHVDFSYDPGKPIIRDFSLHARPGELTAIVGPTGAGKTTIINLLMRFYDVDSGCIRVDGTDIRELTRESLRKAYTMVLQDTWLFHGTIFENIAYGKPDATLEDVIRVCKAAHIHSYISRLPQGYDTVLSDNGTSISKGQKQLLTIARAMLLDAQMLILDEATSNVDTRTEQRIQEAMRTLMAGKTCFVIAHRLSTIRSADHILVMRDGQVVEQGTHETLMEADGFYRQLYQAQFDAVS